METFIVLSEESLERSVAVQAYESLAQVIKLGGQEALQPRNFFIFRLSFLFDPCFTFYPLSKYLDFF